MSEIRNQRRNGALGMVADALQKTKDVANTYVLDKDIPIVGGMGPGDFLLGKMPDEVNDWSYGNMPFQIPEMSRIPQVKQGRKEQLMDTVLGVDIAGLAASKALQMGGRGIDRMAQTTMEAPMQASRRDFLAGTGALAATAAAGGLPALMKAGAKEAAPAMSDVAAPIAKAAATPANAGDIAGRIAGLSKEWNHLFDSNDYVGMTEKGSDEYLEAMDRLVEFSHETNLPPKALYYIGNNWVRNPQPVEMSPEVLRALIESIGPRGEFPEALWELTNKHSGKDLLNRAYGLDVNTLDELDGIYDEFQF